MAGSAPARRVEREMAISRMATGPPKLWKNVDGQNDMLQLYAKGTDK
jgi:hypothetical protein